MSMIFAGALMGLGKGLTKEADRLSEEAKEKASEERSLRLYRAKKDIDLEYKGATKGMKGITKSSGSSSGKGKPGLGSAVSVANTAAPGPDGRTTADIFKANTGQDVPRMNVPQPSPGGKSLPENLRDKIDKEYFKDVPAEDRVRLHRILENKYGSGATKTEVEAWAANKQNWGLPENVKGPGPAVLSASREMTGAPGTRVQMSSIPGVPEVVGADDAPPAIQGFNDSNLAGRQVQQNAMGISAYPHPLPPHIAALRANPSQAAAFDAKFGPGSSKKYLR